MDTQELSMILAIIQTLGDNGKEMFIWWLIMDKGLPAIVAILLGGAFMGIVYCMFKTPASSQR